MDYFLKTTLSKIFYYLILGSFLWTPACNQEPLATNAVDQIQKNVKKVECGEGEVETEDGSCEKKEEEVNPFEDQDYEEEAVPNFDYANLGNDFNREKIQKQKLPKEFEDVPLIVKLVPTYRPIWYDLRGELWAEFNRFIGAFQDVIEAPLQEVGEYVNNVIRPPDADLTKEMSIYQPLHTYTVFEFDDQPLQFYIVGHAANPKVQFPLTPTLVISPSPYVKENMNAIAPPKNYELVYERDGNFTQDALNRCSKTQMEAYEGKKQYPDIEILTRDCEGIIPGMLMGSYNQATGTYSDAFDELFKKQSVAIWKPIPQDGYKCLGHIATNGSKNKPYTEKDFSQSLVDIGVSQKYAMYCIKEEYVVKGKLKGLVTNDGQITIFKIEAADDSGYDDGNMFYAMSGLPSKKKINEAEEDLWVLKKESIKVLEEKPLPSL